MSVPVVVLGANADALVAGHLRARAGRRVVVLDEYGAGAPDDGGWVPPQIVRALGLAEHGLRIERTDPWARAPLPNGGYLELWHDLPRSVESIRRLSPRDADRWPAFCARMRRLARALEPLYLAPPPDPLASGWRGLAPLAGLGLRLRRLGRGDMIEFLRIAPMPVADLLDDWFESDALKGILGAGGVTRLHQGPRSGGTAFALLHRHVGSPEGVFRPARSNVADVLRALPGIEVRSGVRVERIRVRDGRAAAVALAGGDEIAAAAVVSGVDPRRTLLDLLEPGWLDAETIRALRSIRARGVVAYVDLALERAPPPGTLVLAPSLDDLERAYDDVKYRRESQHPYLEAHPVGERGLRVRVQYVPDSLADDGLGARVAALLAPHLGPAKVERLRLPRNLEAECGWPEGQADHAELALDQLLWMRPTPALARYRTPIGGLYLCGPAMHPGAGILGAAGANATSVLLRE